MAGGGRVFDAIRDSRISTLSPRRRISCRRVWGLRDGVSAPNDRVMWKRVEAIDLETLKGLLKYPGMLGYRGFLIFPKHERQKSSVIRESRISKFSRFHFRFHRFLPRGDMPAVIYVTHV